MIFRRNHHDVSGARLRPVLLPDGGLLISVGDTVYRLDAVGKQMWEYSTPAGEELTSEPAFNAAKNEIALVGFDLFFARLDATTGKLKWTANSNGAAVFADVVPYGNGYFVLVDMSGDRENEKGLHLKHPTLDQLDYWGEPKKDF